MERIVYSDNAATTPISKNVYNAMLPYLTSGYGNPSSLYTLGREEKKAMDQAREAVAHSLNCEPNEIIFTSGGSEADNLAIKGLFFSGKLPKNKRHIITSTIEHHAVLYTCEFMERIGYDVTYVKQFFPDGVVHRLVLTRADFVAVHVNLNPSGLVLNLSE